MTGVVSAVEDVLPVVAERPQPDVLPGFVEAFVPVIASASLSGSDVGPSRGPVDGAGVAGRLDEGLDEHGGDAIALGPVFGQAPSDDGEDVRAEVGYLDPRQDEEPRVVDHEGEVLLTQLRRPPDEGVAGGELPRGGGEAEHGEGPAAPVVDGVAHLGADEGLVAEVVVAGDELVPEPALAGSAHDDAHIEGADLIEGPGRRDEGLFGAGSEGDRPGPVLAPLRRGERNPAVVVHGEHGHPGHHVLEPAVGFVPADAAAELLRERMAIQGRGTCDQRAQQRHLFRREVASVVAALGHGVIPAP